MSDGNELTEADQRHYWRLRWLSSLQAFTDAPFQTSKWADPQEANPHYSFVECMCCYFDDADLSDKGSYGRRIERGYLTLEEASAVADFHLLADQYRSPGQNDYNAKAILSDPAWRNVVEAAQSAQARLLRLLTSPYEVAALTRPMVWEKLGWGFQASYPDPV